MQPAHRPRTLSRNARGLPCHERAQAPALPEVSDGQCHHAAQRGASSPARHLTVQGRLRASQLARSATMPKPVTARYRARDGTEHLVLVQRTPEGRWQVLDPR